MSKNRADRDQLIIKKYKQLLSPKKTASALGVGLGVVKFIIAKYGLDAYKNQVETSGEDEYLNVLTSGHDHKDFSNAHMALLNKLFIEQAITTNPNKLAGY